MHPVLLLGGLMALTVSASVSGPSLSAAVAFRESRFSALDAARCLPGEERTVHCPGFGGMRVVLSGDRRAVSLTELGRAEPTLVTEAAVPGAMIEWRGGVALAGFVPDAVIVPVEAGGRPALAVVRFEPGCADRIAIVDGQDEAALSRARRRADNKAVPAQRASLNGRVAGS